MNAKYLVGFELKISSSGDYEDEAKISFEMIQEKREFFMEHFNVKHIEIIEREEAKIYLTIDPIQVPLISIGEDEISKELVNNFEDMYLNFQSDFNFKGVYYSINPIYFKLKYEDLVIYRKLSRNVEVYKDLTDEMLGNYCHNVLKSEISICRQYHEKYIVNPYNPNIYREEDIFW